MREGIGLLTDPILLTAILEDTGYPAQSLFNDNITPAMNMNMVLGPGTVNSLENIIYRAVQDAQSPVTRVAKIEKRLTAAMKIFGIVQMLINSNDFSMAVYFLFANHSKMSPRLYRHFEDKNLSQIDNLIRCIIKNHSKNTQEINNNFGKLLSLCYIIFEVTRISSSFIIYSKKRKNGTLSPKSKYRGFDFHNNYSKQNLEKDIKLINEKTEDIVNAVTKNGNIIFNDGNDLISCSNLLLCKLLQKDFDFSYYSDLLSQDKIKDNMLFKSDFSFDKYTKIKPRYACEIDDTFISLVNKIKTSISVLANGNTINNRKTIFAKSIDDNKSDEIDDTADEDENDDADYEDDDTICGDNEEWLDADDVEIKKPDGKNDNTIDKEKNTAISMSSPNSISNKIKPGKKNRPTKYNPDK
jgi:hypothetical protein